MGVLELGASALAMFSSRAGAGAAFADSGTVPVLAKLLSPLYAPVVVVNVANAVGNLSGGCGHRRTWRCVAVRSAHVRLCLWMVGRMLPS